MANNRVKLTDEFAREAQLPERGERRYRDAESPSLGLRVRANGKRSWLRLTNEGRTVRTRVIGDAGAMPAEEARRAALGKGPECDMPTVAAFAERFLADWKPRWAPRTEQHARRTVARLINPAFGSKLVDEVRRPEIVKWLAALGENSSRADLACSTMSRLMAHAETLGLRTRGSNPAAGLRKRKGFRTRYLSAGEFARLWAALDAFEAACPREVAVLRLLIYTGARRAEIAALRWSQIDGPRIRCDAAKCGPRTIWLSRQAQAILERQTPAPDSDFVFAADSKSGNIDERLGRAWPGIRKSAKLADLRIHDLRHSFASIAAANNENLKVIGALLGHRDVDSTLGYAHLGEASIAAASGRNASRLSQLLGDSERPARQMRRRRRSRRTPVRETVEEYGGVHV